MKNAILVHLPHSSIYIPKYERRDIMLDDKDLQHELLMLTDRYTDELFDCSKAKAVIHKNRYSRLVFDPERFRDDDKEMMSAFGMGAIYSKSLDGGILRGLSPVKREKMMAKYYDPYHRSLEDKTVAILQRHGKCLIIDGHSFPSLPLPFEADKSFDRPDICIGTCDFHTPEWLVSAMEAHIKGAGMTVRRNAPFAGTLVPMKFYMKDSRVLSVMIEINRRLYMDEATGRKLPSFAGVRDFIEGLLGESIRSCGYTNP